ncbi:ribosomal RNA large subunit methyltransferase K/L [Desulfuromonas versatilis]|uniref:Ribosomal RNA large subunit methyltransferase K/L n=1 Tax=Desulfuromonas versatilis TaxID=2802975 RepID=A0ABN6DWK2_9BACT|nr:bifunctional 23S rRNA (guanine(2069)-N(7))-methyltransferase RlmK/23S rRNA (guanine(2445)-N(2))-methyltransferase RlmL [Desulfuromonas versatilis]BCR04420.1 ribosomal RNA large subunit methyltransferase K/L [Desulfuromonas versatilis]
MSDLLNFFATAPKGMEQLLAEELNSLGAVEAAEARAGASFSGTLETAYRACLWSRLASRVLLPLASFAAADPEALYQGVRSLAWQEHLAPQGTLAVDCSLSGSNITHSQFAALKVKDAIVDQFRDACGVRPSVDTERPDIRVNLHLHRNQATLSLDLSGESLHRRGYREEAVLASLKENLAAAILYRAGWPAIAAAGGTLIDPTCGSGTLVLEGALIAADIAPGLQRGYFGFLGWRKHDQAAWERLLAEARQRREAGLEKLPVLVGYDADHKAIRAAWANAERAGLASRVHFEKRDLKDLDQPGGKGVRAGLVVANPPYGERLGEIRELMPLYATLGSRLRECFQGWRASIITGNPDLGKQMGIRARRMHTLYNGALECKLLHFEIDPQWFVSAPPKGAVPASVEELSEGARMFANRLRKNLKNLGRWAKKQEIGCYRLYDADMPEYAVAVDLYETWVHVQEYAPPKSIDPKQAEARLQEVAAALPLALEVPEERIFYKVRQRQKGSAQYEKLDQKGEFHEVAEGNCRFLVNFTDYLDTGLFLDHRPTRQMIQELAAGKRFLNLFGYTGTASVHAAKGGATSTTTVDMSRTYLEWAKKNLALNGFAGRNHQLIQGDCLAWLAEQKEAFELIFLDPPTFSTSKRMEKTFDVQRDHVPLLQAAARLLAPGGLLIFSNNYRRFKMDREALAGLDFEEITAQTIPRDFERNPRIHNCWKITRKG